VEERFENEQQWVEVVEQWIFFGLKWSNLPFAPLPDDDDDTSSRKVDEVREVIRSDMEHESKVRKAAKMMYQRFQLRGTNE